MIISTTIQILVSSMSQLTLLASSYADIFHKNSVEFNGFDVLSYYIYYFQNFFAGYSWQVRTAYGIVMACILVMILIFVLFIKDIRQRHNRKKKQQKIDDEYLDAFRTILCNDVMTYSEMETLIGKSNDEVRKNQPMYYVHLLAKARMEIYEVVYLPNLQYLADFLGVREYFENNLLKGKDVFQTLQILLMFQLIISEGRLAKYVNSGNADIRMMARMCYILCSDNDPYRYLQEDLDAPQSILRPMILHYIFGWMKARDRHMPNFLMTSDRLKNESMAAFMIREVAYWGSDDEKNDIKKYIMAERRECRSAAINVAAMLADKDTEEELIANFEHQPEILRRDTIKAILAIKSGTRLPFLVHAYEESSTRETRELALSCIYNYGDAGRREFEEIRARADEEDRVLMDQIDSANLLVMIHSYHLL